MAITRRTGPRTFERPGPIGGEPDRPMPSSDGGRPSSGRPQAVAKPAARSRGSNGSGKTRRRSPTPGRTQRGANTESPVTGRQGQRPAENRPGPETAPPDRGDPTCLRAGRDEPIWKGRCEGPSTGRRGSGVRETDRTVDAGSNRPDDCERGPYGPAKTPPVRVQFGPRVSTDSPFERPRRRSSTTTHSSGGSSFTAAPTNSERWLSRRSSSSGPAVPTASSLR